jgi:hypothetical protein
MTSPNDPNQPPGGYGPPPPPGGGYGPPPPGGGGGYGGQPQINNFLVPSILTIFCCWPLAIVAIINAAKVNGLLAQGDYAGAQAAANNAKRWAIIAAVVGVVGLIIGIILNVAVLSSTTTTTS